MEKLVLHGMYDGGYDHEEDIIKIFEYKSYESALKIFNETFDYNNEQRKDYIDRLAYARLSGYLNSLTVIEPCFKKFLGIIISDNSSHYFKLYRLNDFIENNTITCNELVSQDIN